MMEVYTGKPGAGKSYGALLEGMDELEAGIRVVVTNCAFLLDELNAYYQRKGRRFVDVYARVRLITREEAQEFWRYRGTFTVLPSRRKHADAEAQIEPVVNLAELPTSPVLYILDEAHVLFDARNWAKSSAALTFYNSQHRKFGDDVVMVTQFLKLLEVRVRGFAERYHVFRNFAGTRVFQVLQMPKKMREVVYSAEPGPGVEADYEKWRTLDLERAKCYDTTAGVGVTGGRVAEKRGARRGFVLPWWSVLVGLVCLALFVSAAAKYGARSLLGKFAGNSPTMVRKGEQTEPGVAVELRERKDMEVKKETSKPGGSERGASERKQAARPAVSLESLPGRKADRAPLWVRGIVVRGDRVNVMLSDGRTLTEVDRELERVDRNSVVISGERVYLERSSSQSQGQRPGANTGAQQTVFGGGVAGFPEGTRELEGSPKANVRQPPQGGGALGVESRKNVPIAPSDYVENRNSVGVQSSAIGVSPADSGGVQGVAPRVPVGRGAVRVEPLRGSRQRSGT